MIAGATARGFPRPLGAAGIFEHALVRLATDRATRLTLAVDLATPERRAAAVRITIAAALAAGMLSSWRLWFDPSRSFPKTPLFGALDGTPAWVGASLAAAAILSCLCAAALPSRRLPFLIALGASLGLAALDQMRWQPWCYQYWITLLALTPIGRPGARPPGATLDVVRWTLVATYLWSGLHKCHGGFARHYRSDLVADLIAGTQGPVGELVRSGAYQAGPSEVLIAILLAIPRTRAYGVVLACGLHLLILLLLGPLADGDNPAIWPWNAAMIALVITLFWRHRDGIWNLPPNPTQRAVAVTVAALVFAMPALSLGRAWPRYLSFHLYSGTEQRLQLVLTPSGVARLDPRHRTLLVDSPASPQLQVIDFQTWSLAEFGAPVVDEDRVLLYIGRALADRFGLGDADGFFYRDFPHFQRQRGWDRYTPGEMRAFDTFPPLRQPWAR